MAKDEKKQRAVPTSRIGRFARVAKLAGGVAGGMLAEGSRQLRAGKRPRAKDMLLTPGNARRVTDELSKMRGAAMKVGQILSMDTGDFLPRELADILARLRDDASTMPAEQLARVMEDAYGEDWEQVFYGFEFKPLAAASIGQVHRAISPDGREIVLKIQYPGVAKSIDSDVDNIASLFKLSGLMPEGIDIQPLLDDAKLQLKDEANYLTEAKYLEAFNEVLGSDDRFVLPELLPDFTTENVLAMTYVSGRPIEVIEDLPQADRDRVMATLIELMFKELFELRMVQTDPNFANYMYRPESGEIVLLDFGATRHFKAGFTNNYRSLMKAAMAGNEKRLMAAAEKLGYVMGEASEEYRALVLEMFLMVLEPLTLDEEFDFGNTDLPARMAEMAEPVQDFREFWQAPPTDAVYFHRKLGGMFLLASRIGARVNVRELILQFL
jgi:predicted unusual protein kinase regulating ubiquinone biosynthesis (AarF/ABC1/UbiB family)